MAGSPPASSRRAGFDYSRHVRFVCEDLVSRLGELRHIDLDRVAIAVSQARKPGPYGLFASLTPLRCEGGRRTHARRGRHYTCQRVCDPAGREYLYIVTVCLPRFQDQQLLDALGTLIHELWHISPQFDGDLRRHGGRCYVHTHSQADYDREMRAMAERWLAAKPPSTLYAFLEPDFATLARQFGGVYGVRIRRPKMIPISADTAAQLEREDQHQAARRERAG